MIDWFLFCEISNSFAHNVSDAYMMKDYSTIPSCLIWSVYMFTIYEQLQFFFNSLKLTE